MNISKDFIDQDKKTGLITYTNDVSVDYNTTDISNILLTLVISEISTYI